MDTKLEKKQSKLKIILIISASIIAVVLFATYFLKQKKTYNVPSDEIQISEVTYGKFEDLNCSFSNEKCSESDGFYFDLI